MVISNSAARVKSGSGAAAVAYKNPIILKAVVDVLRCRVCGHLKSYQDFVFWDSDILIS